MKGFSKNEFLSDLTVFTSNIDYNVDLVTLWNTFKANFISLYDKYAPLRTYRVKGNAQPWITDEIVQEMRFRDKLHTYATKQSDELLFNLYRKTRKKVTKLIRNAKSAYFRDKIVKNNI